MDLGFTNCSNCLEHWYIVKINVVYYLQIFPGLGAAGLVCSGGWVLSRCSFHFWWGWMSPHNWVMFWSFGYYEFKCPLWGALWIKVSNIVLGLTVSLIWLLDFVLCKCSIFLMCPSFCLCWLHGRCPLYLPLGRMHVCFLGGVGRISTCCSHTWSLWSVLGIWFWWFFRSVLCTSFYSRGRLAGICHSCHTLVSLMFRCHASFSSVVCGECDFDVSILKQLCNESHFLPNIRELCPFSFLSVSFLFLLFTNFVQGRDFVIVVGQDLLYRVSFFLLAFGG